MKSTVRKCVNCGSVHIQVYSWVDALHHPYYFCSMKCKEEFFAEEYPAMVKEEEEREEQEASVLPEMRVSIASKKEGRGTVVRSYRQVGRRTDTGSG